MRVKMKVAVSGTRNGETWPPIGGVIDLPDPEAESLLWMDLAAPDEPRGGPARQSARSAAPLRRQP
jgi:hypothetical protein